MSYNSIDELLADDEIELIVVNTPNNTHFDFTMKALNAGKHVLLEKPAAATGKEVKEMFDLAREKGLHLMLYQNRRYDSGFMLTRDVIESGRLGELITPAAANCVAVRNSNEAYRNLIIRHPSTAGNPIAERMSKQQVSC